MRTYGRVRVIHDEDHGALVEVEGEAVPLAQARREAAVGRHELEADELAWLDAHVED